MKISRQIQDSVINDYLNTDLKVQEIAVKHQLCRQSIRHIILENNLELREKSINTKTQKLIVRDYTNGESNKNLVIKYNVHRVTIQRILLINGIKLRKQEEIRKHEIDFNFFKKINNEFKAYFLGLAYADGNLSRNCIDISLVYTDRQILEDISKVIYGKVILSERKSKKVVLNSYVYNNKKQYRFIITCKSIANDLKKHGLIENKTFTIRMPKLKKELLRHFIRGYMDGDGCIFIDKNNSTHKIHIISNQNFCNDIKNVINNVLNISSYVNNKKGDVFSFDIYGKLQVLTFLDWIYKDCTIKLNRKFDKYKQLQTL